MTAKEFMNQAYRLDQRINCKLEQIHRLRSDASRITPSYGGEVVSRSRNVHSAEDTYVRILEAEQALNRQIDELVDLKRDIQSKIERIENGNYRLLLEQRYLLYYSWSRIADNLGVHSKSVFRMHNRALKCIEKFL